MTALMSIVKLNMYSYCSIQYRLLSSDIMTFIEIVIAMDFHGLYRDTNQTYFISISVHSLRLKIG